MRTGLAIVSMLIAACVIVTATVAQFPSEQRVGRNGVPDWQIDREFADDVFTFVRIRYNSQSGWRRWATDYPDSDLNFSFRLQQLTALKVAPDGKVLWLTDETLFDYPFLYLIEPGGLMFDDAEVKALRTYLLRGGFLMVDDFWGQQEWDNFEYEIRRVFPKRPIEDLTLDHEIFHCVYDLAELPQVPSIGHAMRGITYEPRRGPDGGRTPHYRVIHDDQGRMMMIICHNTDLGDGWEREGDNHYYFKEFSEKWAYPMGINIVFYAMTH